ncbi:hypothetical protein RHECNPAF_1990015 [Rhizobium etli CNPAF512]|nr:hypothetical protein RHECNPAF_1990015 [Rhizobium etli CNPAF512]
MSGASNTIFNAAIWAAICQFSRLTSSALATVVRQEDGHPVKFRHSEHGNLGIWLTSVKYP